MGKSNSRDAVKFLFCCSQELDSRKGLDGDPPWKGQVKWEANLVAANGGKRLFMGLGGSWRFVKIIRGRGSSAPGRTGTRALE